VPQQIRRANAPMDWTPNSMLTGSIQEKTHLQLRKAVNFKKLFSWNFIWLKIAGICCAIGFRSVQQTFHGASYVRREYHKEPAFHQQFAFAGSVPFFGGGVYQV
jgi:hypothetical protein